MSRQSKYTLTFQKFNKIECKIAICKSTDDPEGFHQGKDGRLVKTVKVLTKDDVVATDISTIEQIVPWAELEHYLTYRDDGIMKMIKVDKGFLTSQFQKSDVMKVISLVPLSGISPRMYEGHHYFVYVQKDSKTKTAKESDKQVYSIIYDGLNSRKSAFIIRFVDSNKIKYGALYVDSTENALMFSILIYSNYQRKSDADKISASLVQLPKEQIGILTNNLLKVVPSPEDGVLECTSDCIQDIYQIEVDKYLEKLKSGQDEQIAKLTIKTEVQTEFSVLDTIMGLFAS